MMRIAAIVLLFITSAPNAAEKPAGRIDVEPEDLRTGLIAHYSSLVDPQASAIRIELKPAFYLGRSSPHPRLPVGAFECNWTGIIAIRDQGPLTFSAFVGGELTMTIDGVNVLEGRGTSDNSQLMGKTPLERAPGYYKLSIRFRSIADVPARLQIWWEGPTFAREPLPAWRLAHLEEQHNPTAKRDTLAAQGRSAAATLGCARCHASALPAVDDLPPGPSLADAAKRLGRTWVLHWLGDPASMRPDAHMPALFGSGPTGYVERWLVADYLTGGVEKRAEEAPAGDQRAGRLAFLGLGCAACHFVPDVERAAQRDLNRTSIHAITDRMSAKEIAAFVANPHARYPDGRMPRLPVTPEQGVNMAAYLSMWSKPMKLDPAEAPSADQLRDAVKRLGANNPRQAAIALMRDKGCVSCHSGLGDSLPRDTPIVKRDGGCMGEKTGPRYELTAEKRKQLEAYLEVAGHEKHPSPFTQRQRRLTQAGCLQCHQRDSDRPPPIEEAGSTLGGAFLQELPFLKTPRLTYPHQKLNRSYLATTVREGTSGLRWSRYSYRMPAFGHESEALVQALAEGDGELPTAPDDKPTPVADPTLATLHGSRLVGFQGYACVSCHVWNGQLFGSPDPGTVGPDLTRTAGRIRREWFDRFLEAPLRCSPNTPMPSIFERGKPATLNNVLDGDSAKQKDALWALFAMGKNAPSPQPPQPVPIPAPADGDQPIVAQIPIRTADGKAVESISVLFAGGDLLINDLGEGSPHRFYTGAQILRNVQGRIRQFHAAGTEFDLAASPAIQLVRNDKKEMPGERILLGYDRLPDGARIRWELKFGDTVLDVEDNLRIVTEEKRRTLQRRLRVRRAPLFANVELRNRIPAEWKAMATATLGGAKSQQTGDTFATTLSTNRDGMIDAIIAFELPPARAVPAWESKPVQFADAAEGSLVRPGYRAIAYPRPKLVSGEDRILPAAVAVRPKDGQVFVASLKTGELFALRDPTHDGKQARFDNYARGLFQDALSMLADDEALYVLHRRNLTKIAYREPTAEQFDRFAALPHGVADTYDYAYGLARQRDGRFVISYAPYSNASLTGAGGAIRLLPGKAPEEISYGMRNPLGWCAGPDGEIFFTDNQGDWVAANKLSHVGHGVFHGWPNSAQKQHTTKPHAKTTIWVPYGWARSINGVTYDNTGGKFGPFAGQFFLAELMFGGAIIRGDVERVNGVYQGACFPFWGKGLLGPVSLAFDPKGPLYVGGITEPGWMAQPDRGALFRIDFTGEVPFEMQSIRVRPQGFRVTFTTPVDRITAEAIASYRLESYRYEYTGAYGSPELDRQAVKIERVDVAADGMKAELFTAPLVKDRVYLLSASGVRDRSGKALVNLTGAYTLNEVPQP